MDIPAYTYIDVRLLHDKEIALVKFNRPKSGNSLLPQMLSEMVSALKYIEAQPQIRIIVQSGAGKFFCTGMELVERRGMSFAIGSDFHELNRLLIRSDKILIAAVNGPAAGYGVSSLALYDLVYAVPEAYMFTPFVKWGMAAEGSSSFSFPRLMGHQRAASLFLAGERITAQRAHELGLVSKILPQPGFLDRVVDIASTICDTSPPDSLKETKRLMREPVKQLLLEANDRECKLIHTTRYGFQEYQDAIKQFQTEQEQKRKLKSKI